MPEEKLRDASFTGVSIIVPLLNEAASIGELIEHLNTLDAEQVIVVDGGSSDATAALMKEAGFDVVQSAPSRAKQMNLGASKATQSTLLFLHADTQLPLNYKQELAKASVWGRFDVRFNSRSISMQVIAFFMKWRSRFSSVATGDQAIFVDKAVFDSINGFPDYPIMEDVAFCKRMRQLYRPYNSSLCVITSARRWQQNGVISTVLKMWWYRLAFFLGVSPLKLKKSYSDVR